MESVGREPPIIVPADRDVTQGPQPSPPPVPAAAVRPAVRTAHDRGAFGGFGGLPVAPNGPRNLSAWPVVPQEQCGEDSRPMQNTCLEI